MTKPGILLFGSITAAAFLVVASSAALAANYWSAIATSCAPDAAAIQGNRYRSSGDTTIRHRGKNVDKIVLICGVPPNHGAISPGRLTLTYADSTATGTKAFVRAQFFSATRAGGVKTLIASVSSNDFSGTALTEIQSVNFNHAVDFAVNYYFVRIELDRSASTQAVSAVGVALDDLN